MLGYHPKDILHVQIIWNIPLLVISQNLEPSHFFHLIKTGFLTSMYQCSPSVYFTWHDLNSPISRQSTSWHLGVKSKCYEHHSCVRLGMLLPWGHVELGKSSHHVHHMPNMSAMVAPRNMFGWDSYFNLKVICIQLI